MTNPKIQLGPDNLYINDKPITDMTIEERIEKTRQSYLQYDPGDTLGQMRFMPDELDALLKQVQDEQRQKVYDHQLFRYGAVTADVKDSIYNSEYAYTPNGEEA